MGKPEKTEFTPASAASFLIVIEAVFPTENCREMEDLIDDLRSYGAAVVVKKMPIAEDLTAAAAILQRRAWRP